MPWPGTSLWHILLLLAATVGPPGIQAQGNVGCLYSERLCIEGESCYKDNAFGRCLQASDVTEDDLFRYDLEREVLHELSAELRRLFTLGYRWSHVYTQCRLQAMLYSFKHDLSFDSNVCTHLVDQDLEGALKALEGQVPLEPEEVAIIKYTPSVDNPHGEFADELYYPPVDEDRARQTLREQMLSPDAIDLDLPDPYQPTKRAWIPQMHRRSLPQYFSEQYNTPTGFRLGQETRDALEFLPPPDDPPQRVQLTIEELTEMYPVIKYLSQMRLTPKQIQKFVSPENSEKLAKLLEEFEEKQNNLNLIQQVLEETQSEALPYEIPESRIYFDEGDSYQEEYGSGHPVEIFRERKFDMPPNRNDEEIFRELKTLQEMENERFDGHWGKPVQPGVYTEGGMVGVGKTKQKNTLDKILDTYNNLGFKRPERLDVKKPGPPFDAQIAGSNKQALEKMHKIDKDNTLLPTMMKKEPRGVHPNPSHEIHDPEVDYVYVSFKKGLKTWKQGQDIIQNISALLHLEPTAFSEGQADMYFVYFKVQQPNSRGLNASEVAKRIDLVKDELKGVEVTSVGIGDKTKMQTVVSAPLNKENQFYIVLFMVCGVLGAMIIAALLLILIKRHIKSREKLQGLARPDTEASKDYQDLCRARMATKGQTATGSGESVHGRITSLSRESEQSPSSRSSTSSWSEEPALHNMDISTGHMVLSYMEDHLKNKDRLEQEWVALCAYVAEPCETKVALQKSNIEKNRYPEIIPYDHARVLLNELTNIAGSDYINASSITDHDPRNPAYIATQGPLPNTAADFWQLIWEQGAVVIVMLTRLTEGGVAMCHRYWPEEGSELYHIYEVHLVSEHIWCDDYLVRSFYLKNVRTSETRTVTQFHFLSWAEAGVPGSTKALLEFRRKVNKSYRGRSCPIVVHCSDGAGRTGTYCLIDMVLSRMAKGAKEIDIAATLEHLRDQRPRMVATKQQFEFVLTAVAEEVHAILKALPPQPTPPAQNQEKDK